MFGRAASTFAGPKLGQVLGGSANYGGSYEDGPPLENGFGDLTSPARRLLFAALPKDQVSGHRKNETSHQ